MKKINKSVWITFSLTLFALFMAQIQLHAQPTPNTIAPPPAAANSNVANAGSTSGEYNELEDPNQGNRLIDPYTSHYYKLLVDAFERAGEWRGEMPREFGVIQLHRIYGAAEQLMSEEARIKSRTPNPLANQDSTSESFVATPPSYMRADGVYDARYFNDLNFPEGGQQVVNDNPNKVTIKNQRVLGVKVSFFRRGYTQFAIYPAQDIWIDGVAKGIEVYVSGRQKPHTLYAIIQDLKGHELHLPLTTLDFQGWRRVAVPIPPAVIQIDPMNTNHRGLLFKGFLVKTDPLTTMGTFYMYFDNLSFLVDRFFEETQSQTQIQDMW